MKKKKKKKIILLINKYFNKYKNFSILDISRLNSNFFFIFKKECFKHKIKIYNIKNTLLKKSLLLNNKKKILKKILKILYNNNTLIFFKYINTLIKIIKKNSYLINNKTYPLFKLASLNGEFFFGEKYLDFLSNIKSKKDLILKLVLILKIKIIKFINFIILNNKINIINLINNIKNNKINKIK
ncbi:MAG: 50S ribosomal protein L10 [Candidatus Shikimatogenerans bostrichidophilus]|nr:MAG: 50S ribosomal protein L10 [Candidatus Shikimatogenerans bostrichidophilus]